MKKLLLILLGHRRWTLALALVLSLAALPAVAQSDECATAPLLTSNTTCINFAGTMQGATQSLPAGACSGISTTPTDVWFRFVAVASTHTVRVVGNASFAPVVELRSGTCPGTAVNCSFSTSYGGTAVLNATGLTVGATYYLRLYSYIAVAIGRRDFDICITHAPLPTCPNPTNVTVDYVDNTSASVFFTPVTGATSYTVTYTPTGGGTPITRTATSSPVALTNLTPGTSYTLTFQTTCAVGGTSPVLTQTFTTQVSPFNDYPDTSPELTMGTTCVPVTSNTLGATPGPTTPASTCGASGALRDVWFVLRTLPGQTAASITVTGSAAGQIRAFSAPTSSGPFTLLGCAAGTGPNTVSAPLNLTGLQGNRVYYIAVSGYGPTDAQGYFTICAVNTTTAACNTPGVQATNITSNGAQISINPGTNNASYTVTYTPTGGTATTVTTTSSPVTLTGLTPLTTYAVTVVATCAVGSAAPANFTFRTTAIPPPANNECSGAILLTSGTTCVPVSGTTFNATQSLPAVNCLSHVGVADDDVWYRFVATGTSHTVTVTQGDIDAVIDVRSGSCPGVNIACRDASNTAPEVLALSGLTVGATYYVRVYSFDSSVTDMGTFTICVTGAAVPTCTTPSSVQAGSITSTGAQVSFTPGTSNTGYAVTYTPAGGTATTVTGTASPIALTGLTPGTAYTATLQATCASGTVAPVSFTFTTTAATAPANDNPTGATLLAMGSTCTPSSSSTVGATTTPANGYTIPSGCGITTAPRDVWFRFVTQAGQTAATVTVTGTAAGQLRVFSASSSAGPFTQLACTAGNINNLVAPPVTVTNLTGNTIYYVMVANYATVDASGIFTICVTGSAASGPANNECAAATLLTSGTTCVPTSGTTVGATQSLAATCAGTADDDVWYRFVATGTAHTVSVAGAIDAVVDVRSGSCPGTNIGCADLFNSGGTEVVSLTGLTVGSTYYVRVYSYGGASTNAGAFTICVTNAAAPTCTTPTDGQVTATSSTTAQVTFTPLAGNTSFALTYTPTGGATVSTTASGSPVNITGLAPNTTYTLTIQAVCAGGGTASVLSGTFTTPASTGLANNECTGATLLTSGTSCTPTSGTTVGATQSLAAITCGSFTGTADDDVWYRFVATSTAHTVTVAPGAALDAVVDVRAGTCSGTNIGCADAGSFGISETVSLTGLTVGATYYVRVYSYGSATSDAGAFTICVTHTGATICANPADVAFGTATNTSIPVTFTPVAGASYLITYTPANGQTVTLTPAPTTSPAIVAGLTPGTFYSLTFQTVCSGGGTAPVLGGTFVTTTTGITPPANDNPSGATTLAVSSTCAPSGATNLGATVTAPNGYANPGACGVAANPKDVWFKFTTLNGQTAATVTVSGSAAGLVRVFAAGSSAGPFAELGCSGAATNNTVTTPVSLTGLSGNTTYYVSVSGASSNDSQGPFTICVTGTGTTPVCPAVTNVGTSNATPTSATLTFTPAAGAVGYTVTLTPGSGNPVTIAATGSPVALTSLSPSTPYTVCVTAICSGGGTATPACVGFSTPAPPCPAVTQPGADNITTTSAIIAFLPAAGAASYTVSYTPQGGNTTTLTVTGSPVNLTGLLPGTQYTVVIRTNCTAGQTSADVVLNFSTATPCTAVTNLVAGSLSATEATLSFTPPATGANAYIVTYTPAGGNTVTLTATGSPVSLTGLLPGTQYTATVTTDCGQGSTSPLVSTTFTTTNPVCNAATNVAAGNITPTSAGVSFTPAAGAVSYTVSVTPAGGTTTTQTATGSPAALSGLQPGTVYTVSIVTTCAAGQTSGAVATTFTTPAPAPTNGTAGSITESGASISFVPAAGATSYTVTVTPQGGTPTTLTATGSPVVLTGLLAGTGYTVTIVANYPGGGTSAPLTTTFTTLLGTATWASLAGGTLTVFPNPAHRAFTLSLPALGATRTAHLTLVNALGQTVSTQTIALTPGGTQTQVAVAGLATGLYTVRVQAGAETATTRLSVE